MSGQRCYAIGFRPVNAPGCVGFRYLYAETDKVGWTNPQFVFTFEQVSRLGRELALRPDVGAVSIRSKEVTP